jgi:hypothetical protein
MDWDEITSGHVSAAWQKTEDTFIKHELLDLAAVCEEAANNIEDRRPSG